MARIVMEITIQEIIIQEAIIISELVNRVMAQAHSGHAIKLVDTKYCHTANITTSDVYN